MDYNKILFLLSHWQPDELLFRAPNGDTIQDTDQVQTGYVEFSRTCNAGYTITLEHSEVLD